MRASEENGGMRYLGTGRGYTLYSHANDTPATADSMPQSACSGTCLDDYVPFTLNAFRLASPIDPSDVTVFVRADSGVLQIAYKGMPLYTSNLDVQSGQLNGAQPEAFSVVEL
jgi:predicted lipoprotein with Yx(FWY)xxD motif